MHGKPAANRIVEAVKEDAKLSINAKQEYNRVDRGNQIITTSKQFGQEYVNIAIRAEVGMGEASIPDGSYTPPPPYKPPPHKPPYIPPPGPGPNPNPGPGPGPYDDSPIPPPEEPPYIPPPITPPGIDCTDVPVLTVSVVTTTMGPGEGQEITVTGGGGTITMTISDPGGVTDPSGTNDGYITIQNGVTNEGCTKNITITVTDQCGQSSSITIGISTIANPGSTAYLAPGTNSFYSGFTYGSTSQCCNTYQLWQYCDGHSEESSYLCWTCQNCLYLMGPPWDPNGCYASAAGLCPGSATCQHVGQTKAQLEAQGCCVGS